MSASVHLRAIVIAGTLAVVALVLGFFTLAMNQTASTAAVHKIVPLKDRPGHATRTPASAAKPDTKPKKKVVVRKPDANLVAALHAGLPRSVARGLAAHKVVVVQLTSPTDSVAKLALGEARVGAGLAGASFVTVNVDADGGDVQQLTRVLGVLPVAPAALVYIRPGTLFVTLPGFNDRTIVQQAVANALSPAAAAAVPATPAAPATTPPAAATTAGT